MKRNDILKYIIPVCFGIVLWTPPCYSFGFPSFDIAEVAGTIKGVITSAQSYASTAQSTISQGKELLALGDSVSSIMKFKDEALNAARKATKEAKKLKNLERLKDLRSKIEGGVSGVKDKISDAKNTVTGVVDQTKDKVSNAVETVPGVTGNKDVASAKDFAASDTGMNSPSDVSKETTVNKVINLPATSSDRSFKGSQSTTKQSVEPKNISGSNPLVVPSNAVNNVQNNSGMLKNPTVDLPNVNVGKSLGKNTVATLPVNSVAPSAVAPKSGAVNNLKLNSTPAKAARTFKTSDADSEINFNLVSSSSFAQLSSSFKGGTTDDGRFVFSDIFASKCNLSFEDAEDEDKVKECFKTWVLCMHNPKKEEALACREEYKKAMHEQIAADLSSSINDKKYASSFETDVAEDLESKSTALTNEREEVAYVGEVNKANQELLLRLMHSMSSRVVQETLLAIEQIDASHYDEE